MRIADIVRKSEKKPMRIFLEDGRNDNRGARRGDGNYDEKRDWFLQNVRLCEALTEKGYDLNYSWGIGRHGQKQAGAICRRCCAGCGGIILSLPIRKTRWSAGSMSLHPNQASVSGRLRRAGTDRKVAAGGVSCRIMSAVCAP